MPKGQHRKSKKVKPKKKRESWRKDKRSGICYRFVDHGEYPTYDQDVNY